MKTHIEQLTILYSYYNSGCAITTCISQAENPVLLMSHCSDQNTVGEKIEGINLTAKIIKWK